MCTHFFFAAVTGGTAERVVAELGGFGLLDTLADADGVAEDTGFFEPAEVGLADAEAPEAEDEGDAEGFAEEEEPEPALPGLLSLEDETGEELGCCCGG